MSDSPQEFGDSSLADYFTAREGELLYTRGEWYRYTDDLWTPTPDSTVRCAIENCIRTARVQTRFGTRAVQITSAKIASVYSIIRDRSTKDLSSKTGFALFKSKRLEWSSGSLVSTIPQKDYYDTVRFDYDLDHDARCPEFKSFLASTLPDDAASQSTILQFTGACILGLASTYQRALVLYGRSGANGKSQLIDVLTGLFPRPYVGAIPIDKMRDRFALHALPGYRINAVSETPSRDSIVSEVFRKIVTGDEIVIEKKYADPTTTRAVAGHMFCANDLSGFADCEPASMRRIVIIEFKQKFTTKAGAIGARICAKEKAGIAALCVREFAENCGRSGVLSVDDSKTFDLAFAQNPHYQFAKSSPHARDELGIYAAYQDYCARRGNRPLSLNNLFTRLRDFGFEIGERGIEKR